MINKMPTEKTHPEEMEKLRHLLKKRIDVIADHAWRERDPAAHLDRLCEVSEAISEIYARCKGTLPARFAHYMERMSYQKALAFLEGAKE